MKKTEIFLYSLYALGIVFKLFKLPLHTVFILLCLLALLIYYVSCWIRKNKDRYSILTGFVTVLWLFLLLAILKHFSFRSTVLISAIIAGSVLLFQLYKFRKLTSGNSVFCLVIIGITIFFNFLPSHATYYLTNIKFNYEIENDYLSWDKYSWFLYRDGKVDEAMQANKTAHIVAENCLKNPKYNDEKEAMALIIEHEFAIKNRNWEKYP